MDQAKPEDQDVSGYFGQRSAHPNLDRLVRLFADRISQFQGQVGLLSVANIAPVAAQPLYQTRFNRAFQTTFTATCCFSTAFIVE